MFHLPDQIVLLDGAMGTMLQKMGLKPGEAPEILNITRPEWVLSVHRAYLHAGSRVIYANTFGASPRKMRRLGYDGRDVIAAGVRLAREAARSLRSAAALCRDGADISLAVIDLQSALQSLGRVTGEQVDEKLLDDIFSRFCVGK